MIQGCRPTPWSLFSKVFSIIPDPRSAIFIESAEEPVNVALLPRYLSPLVVDEGESRAVS